MLFFAEQSGHPWLAAVVAGLAMIVIVIAALGLRRSPRGKGGDDKLRDMAKELDSLTSKLDTLVGEADQRIAELRRLTAKPPFEPVRGKQAAAPSDPLVIKVYELSDTGRTPVQIAEELDEHAGKIELILALRDRASDL